MKPESMTYPRPLAQIQAELADLDKRVQRINEVVQVFCAARPEDSEGKVAHDHLLDGYAIAYDICIGRFDALRRELAQARSLAGWSP